MIPTLYLKAIISRTNELKSKLEISFMVTHSKGKEFDLSKYGIRNVDNFYQNLSTPTLCEEIVRRREGLISHLGLILVRTGHHTGRSPADK